MRREERQSDNAEVKVDAEVRETGDCEKQRRTCCKAHCSVHCKKY